MLDSKKTTSKTAALKIEKCTNTIQVLLVETGSTVKILQFDNTYALLMALKLKKSPEQKKVGSTL